MYLYLSPRLFLFLFFFLFAFYKTQASETYDSIETPHSSPSSSVVLAALEETRRQGKQKLSLRYALGRLKEDKKKEEITILCEKLKNQHKEGSPLIEKIDLRSNELDSDCFRIIADFLGSDRFITNLDLSHNKMDDSSLPALEQALLKNKTLKHLILIDNCFTEYGFDMCGDLWENSSLLSCSYSHTSTKQKN